MARELLRNQASVPHGLEYSRDDDDQSRGVQGFELALSAGSITKYVLASGLILSMISLGVHALASFGSFNFVSDDSNLVQLFDVNGERNLPTWYQVVTIAFSSLLLLIIGRANLRAQRVWSGRHWCFLSLVFAFLSLDELASIHETTVAPLRRILDVEGGVLYFTWVVPAVVGAAMFALLLIPFLKSLDGETRMTWIAAGTLYVSGAVGVEMIGGAYLSDQNFGTFQYEVITTIEELLEILGIVLFIHGILRYIDRSHGTIQFGLLPGAPRTLRSPDSLIPGAKLGSTRSFEQ